MVCRIKGDLEEDSYRILRQYFMQKEGRLYLNKDGIVACKRGEGRQSPIQV